MIQQNDQSQKMKYLKLKRGPDDQYDPSLYKKKTTKKKQRSLKNIENHLKGTWSDFQEIKNGENNKNNNSDPKNLQKQQWYKNKSSTILSINDYYNKISTATETSCVQNPSFLNSNDGNSKKDYKSLLVKNKNSEFDISSQNCDLTTNNEPIESELKRRYKNLPLTYIIIPNYSMDLKLNPSEDCNTDVIKSESNKINLEAFKDTSLDHQSSLHDKKENNISDQFCSENEKIFYENDQTSEASVKDFSNYKNRKRSSLPSYNNIKDKVDLKILCKRKNNLKLKVCKGKESNKSDIFSKEEERFSKYSEKIMIEGMKTKNLSKKEDNDNQSLLFSEYKIDNKIEINKLLSCDSINDNLIKNYSKEYLKYLELKNKNEVKGTSNELTKTYINCDIRFFNFETITSRIGYFDVIMIDPPWRIKGQRNDSSFMFSNSSFNLEYNTLSNNEIMSIPLENLSLKGT